MEKVKYKSSDKMSFSLESIWMNEGRRYEAIYTTINEKGEMNAVPIWVKCINDYDVVARIFEGSTTLKTSKKLIYLLLTSHLILKYLPNRFTANWMNPNW